MLLGDHSRLPALRPLAAAQSGSMSDLITKLMPILHLPDPDAERRFYEQLGLRTTYEGPEYPGFIAVGNDAVEFGLSHRPRSRSGYIRPDLATRHQRRGRSDHCLPAGRPEVRCDRRAAARGLDLPDYQGPIAERDGGTPRRTGSAQLRPGPVHSGRFPAMPRTLLPGIGSWIDG
jgi:hypothetical protein